MEEETKDPTTEPTTEEQTSELTEEQKRDARTAKNIVTVEEAGPCKKKIVVECFFGHVDEYKSEFAFNLASAIREATAKFALPKYITDAFDFVK